MWDSSHLAQKHVA